MSLNSFSEVLVVWLDVEITFEDWEVYYEWVTLALDNVTSQYLICSWIHESAVVVLFWEDIGVNLVICEFTHVQIDGEVFLECLHFDIVIDVLEKLLVADADFSVNQI